ncbi:hypothetical protein CR513_49803, partial [Mucuna pruriens]
MQSGLSSLKNSSMSLNINKGKLIELLVKKAHEGGLMWHFDDHKTYKTYCEHFFWPQMKHYFHNIYDRCLVCKHAKSKVKPQ